MIRFTLVAALVAALILAACGGDDDEPSDSQNGGNSTDAPIDTGNASPTPLPATETPIPNVCQPNPAPGTPATIQVDAPAPLTKHRGSVTVAGRIAAFEATFKIRIFDPNGAVISGATGMAAEGQTLSPFSVDVPAAVVAEQPACIWVYEESAQDGSPTNVAQVPIVVQP
jgi:hypothetical protein